MYSRVPPCRVTIRISRVPVRTTTRSREYGHAVLLYREDTKVAVLATWRKGINTIPGEPVMLPGKAVWKPRVDTARVVALKTAVKKRT